MRSRLVLTVVTVAAIVALATPAVASRVWSQGSDATPDAESTNEIVVDGARYAFDREVPVDLSQLEQRVDDTGNPVWTRAGDPLGAVYVETEQGASRYLPEHLATPDVACPSDATAAAGTIQGTFGDTEVTFIPAGVEPDLVPDQLTQISQASDGRIVYALSEEQPFQELFVTDQGSGLVRYIAIASNGVPATFPDRLDFGGQAFELAPDEPGTTEGMEKVGCALAFPALAPAGEEPGSWASLTIQVGDALVVYDRVGPLPTQSPVASPTEMIEPTVVPTEAPTLPPTVVPTTAPTQAPTEQPTTAPTEAPTQLPTEQPTTAPTEAPTQVPTEQPTIAPTEVPTQAPTEQPTTVPTTAPTTAPTAAPATQATTPAAPTSTPRPTPTPQVLQPPAVVPTLPPDAPPPAAATSPAFGCSGSAGPVGANGLPERLPSALQFQGNSYRFVERVTIEEIGDVDRIGCVGAFTAHVDPADDVIYLTLDTVADTAYRYERASSFEVRVEVTANPRVLVLPGDGDQPDTRYRAGDPLVPSVYSSVSLVLYVQDAEDQQPDRILGFAEGQDLFGEYRPVDGAEPASEEVQARAGEHGILPTLTIGTNPQQYVLVALWEPVGTTTNGWLTLYAPVGEATPAQIVGVDPRNLDVAVFERQGT